MIAAIAAAVSFVVGALLVWLRMSRTKTTGSPTDKSAAVEAAVDAAFKQASANAKEILNASDADIDRRVRDLQERANRK